METKLEPIGKLNRLNLRRVWPNEASDFTPWLAGNIQELGKVLGMELALEATEASVGDFSLDILAKDLGSGRKVVIENQLTQTDHDHLGKVITYAAGFGASVVIWVSESIREEHRQALEWLNQRTDTETEFFGVVVEVLQIDQSNPAYDFKPIVFPNEWQKAKRTQSAGVVSAKGEAYRQYFQALIDVLRDKYKFTGAKVAQPQNWYTFSIGTTGVTLAAVFTGEGSARVELYINIDVAETNKALFDWLYLRKGQIEEALGFALQWQRLDGKQASRVCVDQPGKIGSNEDELARLREWQVEVLLTFKKLFGPLVKQGVKEISSHM